MSDVEAADPLDEVRVEFELTREEGVPLIRWQLRNTLLTPAIMIGIACIPIGAIIVLVAGGSTAIGVILLGVAVLEVLLFTWLLTAVPYRVWESERTQVQRHWCSPTTAWASRLTTQVPNTIGLGTQRRSSVEECTC